MAASLWGGKFRWRLQEVLHRSILDEKGRRRDDPELRDDYYSLAR